MLCGEVMKSNVRTLGTNATIMQAAAMMRKVGVGFLPVCDGDRRVIGTLTDRDITIRAVAKGYESSTPIGAIMSSDLVACRPTDDLQTAEARMMQAHVSRILIVDDDFRLRGVISLSDIAECDRDRAVDALRAIASREARPS